MVAPWLEFTAIRARSRGSYGCAWEAPYARRVDSLTDYCHSEAVGEDDLVVGPLVEDVASLGDDDIARIEAIAMDADDLVGRLVASDGGVTGVVVTSKYLKGRREGLAPADAVRATFNTVGHALLTTTVVFATGFMVFAFSGFEVSWSLGLLVATTILLALGADFLLLPTLLLTMDRKNP